MADQVLKQILECCRFDQEGGLVMSYSEMFFCWCGPHSNETLMLARGIPHSLLATFLS